ncbi:MULTISPECIES: hypothetical protein [unclassified Ruegeria]|nr:MULTISPECIES: hypothetical protein [unclassified Ruegeria]
MIDLIIVLSPGIACLTALSKRTFVYTRVILPVWFATEAFSQ